ncbi:DUF6332 family protein [Streptomyces sp. bgisy100]|uniref:DUF6332 family protein n=1 Tax=Streptomyces sp. bgisy100 TaxID=3413783 RepID=UPI003D7500B0
MPPARTPLDRDALTVELVFAFVTGAGVAAVVFLAVASPALLGELSRAEERQVLTAGAVAGAAGFLWRVVRVLRGVRRAARQPSQPGRTSPDS